MKTMKGNAMSKSIGSEELPTIFDQIFPKAQILEVQKPAK